MTVWSYLFDPTVASKLIKLGLVYSGESAHTQKLLDNEASFNTCQGIHVKEVIFLTKEN